MAQVIEQADFVVVGAGWAGLAAAKTYLQIHPDAKIIVLEAESSVGGVWASHRLYPGLKSNNMVGTYEYSDFPMDEATFGVKPGQHIPGHVMHQYLESFARKYGVLERVRYGAKVESVAKLDTEGWELSTSVGKIQAKKLVVATGMTSQPFLPTIQGQESFSVPLFHSKDFLKYKETLEHAKRVTVLGGQKSAWDVVYAYATAGVEVDWVIRESGHGPCWMSPPYVTPLKRWLEKLVHTRFLTWLSPCIWGSSDGYTRTRSLFHGTFIGRVFVDTFWKILGGDVIGLNNYSSHPETAKLQPWHAAFWTANGLSILNYEQDFFELVKGGKVKIHIADITRLSEGKVHLSSPDTLDTDALICCTGWKRQSPITFLPAGTDQRLGLPHVVPSSNIRDEIHDAEPLIVKADKEILSRFPRLKSQPNLNKDFKSLTNDNLPREDELTGLNLYRFMVPADEELLRRHDIAFAGHMMSISTAMVAQTQGLWISAYFDGALPSLSQLSSPSSASDEGEKSATDIQYEATLHNRFGRWRHPAGWAGKIPDFVFDGVPYLDMLMKDLGLNRWRKGGWREIFQAYGPEDYVGIVGEWLEKEGKMDRND